MQELAGARFAWSQIWIALDVVEDTDLAISAYLQSQFPTEAGEQYLRLYGVLQVLFVQQDAMTHVIEAIRPAVLVELTDVLKEIREVRNASVGHPIELTRNGEVSAHAIIRVSLAKDQFELASFSEKDDPSFRRVDLVDLIEKQRSETLRILATVVNELKREDSEHKAQFGAKKLAQCFSQVTYAFETIGEELRGASLIQLGKWGVGALQGSLRAFESALQERGMGVNTYASIQYLYDKISYPLTELGRFIKGDGSDISTSRAALVYADALRGHFSRLVNIADEIDEEYSGLSDQSVNARS
jgi:hypothetical protein